MLAIPAASAQEDLSVTGEVDGLYPGADTVIPVAITNPQTFAIDVTTVDVQVVDASSAPCPGSMLTFGAPTTTVAIGPGATESVPLAVQMDIDAPDTCQGMTWVLAFEATAFSDDGPDPSADGAGGVIPFTGSDVVGIVVAGIALGAVGSWMVGRHRRSEVAGDEGRTSP
jgi:hypothetical protein